MSESMVLLTGSNLGNRKAMLDQALECISVHLGKVTAVSSVYESEPWGFVSDNLFLNQAVVCETVLSPAEVMASILSIEQNMGRNRSGNGYSSRNVDIDIIYYGEHVVDQEGLIVPHPRLHLRRFVLEPLCELLPDFEHPLLHKTNLELLLSLKDSDSVKRIPI